MTISIDAYNIATQLIAQHGTDAREVAAAKAADMLRDGSLYERRTWRRVQEAVETRLERDLLGDFAAFCPNEAEPQPLALFNPFPKTYFA